MHQPAPLRKLRRSRRRFNFLQDTAARV